VAFSKYIFTEDLRTMKKDGGGRKKKRSHETGECPYQTPELGLV